MLINRKIEELKKDNYRQLPVNRRRFVNPFLLMSTNEALNKIAGSNTVLEAIPDPKNPGSVLPIRYPPRTGLQPTGVKRQEKGRMSGSIPVAEPISGKIKPTAISRPVKDTVGTAVGSLLPTDPLTRMANQNLSELSKDPFFKADGRRGKPIPVDDTDTKGLAPLNTVAESENIDTHHDVSSRNQSGRNDPGVLPSVSLPGTVGNQANLDQVFGADSEGVSSEVQDLQPEDKGDETAERDGYFNKLFEENRAMRQKKEQERRNRQEGARRRWANVRAKQEADKLKEVNAGVPGGGSERLKPASKTTGLDELPRTQVVKPLAEGVASAGNPYPATVSGDPHTGMRRRRRR